MRGSYEEEMFLHLEKLLHRWGNQPRQKGSFRGSEENATAGLLQAEQSETRMGDLVHPLACPSLRRTSSGTDGGWELRLGV